MPPAIAGPASRFLMLLGVLLAAPAAAQEGNAPRLGAYFDPFNFTSGDGRSYITAYAGPLARNKLSRIVRFEPNLASRWLVGFGMGREIGALSESLRIEAEAGLAIQNSEFGAVADMRAMLGARWVSFPWNHYLPTTFAVFTGPSYLSGDSSLEVRRNRTSRFANGMAFELTFALPDREATRGVVRIHHRSPVFGMTGTASPSDAVTFGIQQRF